MVPSERARLRRPGSEEGEARRGERNSCGPASGRKLGGVGRNTAGEEPGPDGQGLARLGPVGKRMAAASPGKHLQERQRGRDGERGLGGVCARPPPTCPGPEWGSRGRRALVEAEKQSHRSHAIRSGWLGGASKTPSPQHAHSGPSGSRQTRSPRRPGKSDTVGLAHTHPWPPRSARWALQQPAASGPCSPLPNGRPRSGRPCSPGPDTAAVWWDSGHALRPLGSQGVAGGGGPGKRLAMTDRQAARDRR